ncbi:autophagy-related protein 17 [Sporodiniella umbellata]|nr:autophagy-related protein 17 [Sporodiniella umbellata]
MEELFDLFVSSKKALADGKEVCEQANRSCEASEKYVEAIDKISPKLLFLNNYILSQLTTLQRIKDFNDSRVEEYQAKTKEKEATLQSLTLELTKIFNMLKERKIDKGILKANQDQSYEDNSPDKTLFDHISDEAIIELQRQADDQIGEMEMACHALVNQSQQISLIITNLTHTQNALRSYDIPDHIAVHENLKTQGDETEKMAEILTDFTKHYDQIVEATRIYRANPERRNELDISVLEDDDDHIPDILSNLKSTFTRVRYIAQSIKEKFNAGSQVKRAQLEILCDLRRVNTSGKAQVIYEKILNTHVVIEEKENDLNVSFQQLSSLATRYKFYASSYKQLLLEIERRKQADIQLTLLKENAVRIFEENYKNELEQRRSWSTRHGEYLPEVLCPFINDLPPKVTVTIETNKSKLPTLSLESVQEAMSEVDNLSSLSLT